MMLQWWGQPVEQRRRHPGVVRYVRSFSENKSGRPNSTANSRTCRILPLENGIRRLGDADPARNEHDPGDNHPHLLDEGIAERLRPYRDRRPELAERPRRSSRREGPAGTAHGGEHAHPCHCLMSFFPLCPAVHVRNPARSGLIHDEV
jgi:hypothetical protein